ncbi:MAG: UbiX family flavin prenyltransferase [Proteobacteria bacterium]|nr:UbiX family flavin prenyltransferase [Pseudomonadota bacterium]
MAEKHKSIILGITGASGTVYGLRLLEYLLSQGTARKRTNSRLRRTNDRSVLQVHEDHEDDENAEVEDCEQSPQGYVVDVVFSNNALKVSKLELDQDWEGLNVQLLKQAVLEHLFKNLSGVADPETILDINAVKKRVNFWHESNIAASIASGSYQVEGMVVSPCSVGTLAHIALGTSHNLISRAADVMLKERKKLILVVRETPFSSIHLRNMLTLSDAGAVILPAIPAFYHRPHSIQDQVDFITGKTLDSFGIDSDLFKRWR